MFCRHTKFYDGRPFEFQNVCLYSSYNSKLMKTCDSNGHEVKLG